MAKATLEERYQAKITRLGPYDCWPWKAGKDSDGYGRISVGGRAGRMVAAHRVGWQLAFGPIPMARDIDHDCHNRDLACPGGPCAHRACQNPAHWCLATRGQNVLRGRSLNAQRARQTHCKRGHLYDQANTYIRPNGNRNCRRCRRKER